MTLPLCCLLIFAVGLTRLLTVVGCRENTATLTALSHVQTLVFPDMSLITTGQSQSCSWIISSQGNNDVISFQVTDWFGPTSHSCVRDYLTIRDGSRPTSPILRLVCGATHFTGTVTSSTGAIYIHIHVFVNDGQRGFALEYWSEQNDPLQSAAPMYGPANYILIGVTVLVTVSFITGLMYLVYREKYREKQAQEGKMKQMLKRRRKGISGISGMEDSCEDHNDDFATSRTDMTSFVDTPSPVLNNWQV